MTQDQVPKFLSGEHGLPGADDLAEIAQRAMATIPAEFRAHLGDIVFRIEDWPDTDTLKTLGIDNPLGLLGLYHGISLAEKSILHAVPQPDMIFLYRRPILAYWAQRTETLEDIVRHVLIHEIGHHFGLSDEDMHAIDDSPDE